MSRPETTYVTPPGVCSWKIGPYSSDSSMMLWTSRCVSTSRMLPTTGSGFGPGISDSGRAVAAVVGAEVVMARSSGQDAVVAGVAGGSASLRTRRSWRRSTTATSSTQAGRTSRLAGWSVAVISSQVAST